MLVRIPHVEDWVVPDIVVAVRVIPLGEENAEPEAYQVQVLTATGPEMTLYSAISVKEYQIACAVRDEIAQHLNRWNPFNLDEDSSDDPSSSVRH